MDTFTFHSYSNMNLTPEVLAENNINPVNEGVNHINVYSKSNNALGKFLTNMNNVTVMTPHGKFRSLESYYHCRKILGFLSIIDPNLTQNKIDKIVIVFSTQSCFDSKALYKKYMGAIHQSVKSESLNKTVDDLIVQSVTSPEFRSDILSALDWKIQNATPEYKDMMIKNNLPYHHYYYYGKIDNCKVHYLLDHYWMLDGINKSINHLRKNHGST